jgi:hypothetical protein
VEKLLRVDVREQVLRLTWRRGDTVLVSNDVPIAPVDSHEVDGAIRSSLSFLDRDWRANGSHHDPMDRVLDQAVLHVRNSAECET